MIIADTGFWLALLNKGDRHHQAAAAALKTLNEPLISTWPVLTETCHLLNSRLGSHAQQRFITSLEQGICQLFELGEQHLSRISQLTENHQDLPMDLADASLVVLAEQLGDGRILSTDNRDFGAYRWKNTKPFENLLGRA